MDMGFRDWLRECYQEGLLTDEEIVKCLEDPWKAYYLAEEYIMIDKMATGRNVQDELASSLPFVKKMGK